jgi:nitric oxide synthase oxygenase domain/subunit
MPKSAAYREENIPGVQSRRDASEKITHYMELANRNYIDRNLYGAINHTTSAMCFAILVNNELYKDIKNVLCRLKIERSMSERNGVRGILSTPE